MDLVKLLLCNRRIAYNERVKIILADCESIRECRKDYYIYDRYANMLEHAASKLRRRAEHIKEDMKHGKR